jgi:DNA repair protein RadC
MIVRHFLRFIQTASAGERAEAVSALTRAYLHSDMSGDFREAAEAAMMMLLDDPSPVVRRALAEAMRAGDVLASPNNVRDYLKLNFAHQQYESFVVLFVDAQNRVLACEEMFRGTLTQTAVYPREVVKRTLAVNAAAVILAHNHPSGLAEPSFADNTLTRSLANALSMVDVRVLDHLIVAGNTVLSYAERGLL